MIKAGMIVQNNSSSFLSLEKIIEFLFKKEKKIKTLKKILKKIIKLVIEELKRSMFFIIILLKFCIQKEFIFVIKKLIIKNLFTIN